MSRRGTRAKTITVLGMVINIFLTVLKMGAGIFGRSGALIADAVHSLSDFTTDLIALFGIMFGDRPADDTHHYGHGKFETLSAAILGLVLFLTGGGILIFALFKIINFFRIGEVYRPGWVAFFTAGLSVLVKEWLFHVTIRVGRTIDSPVVLANAWHHRSDSLSSVGAMIGVGGAIILGDRWLILDPLAAMLVSMMVIREAVPIFRRSLNELLEGSADAGTELEILDVLRAVPQVKNPHNLKARKVGHNTVIDLHVEVDKSLTVQEAHDICTEIEKKIKMSLGPETQITIHIEPEKSEG